MAKEINIRCCERIVAHNCFHTAQTEKHLFRDKMCLEGIRIIFFLFLGYSETNLCLQHWCPWTEKQKHLRLQQFVRNIVFVCHQLLWSHFGDWNEDELKVLNILYSMLFIPSVWTFRWKSGYALLRYFLAVYVLKKIRNVIKTVCLIFSVISYVSYELLQLKHWNYLPVALRGSILKWMCYSKAFIWFIGLRFDCYSHIDSTAYNMKAN